MFVPPKRQVKTGDYAVLMRLAFQGLEPKAEERDPEEEACFDLAAAADKLV